MRACARPSQGAGKCAGWYRHHAWNQTPQIRSDKATDGFVAGRWASSLIIDFSERCLVWPIFLSPFGQPLIIVPILSMIALGSACLIPSASERISSARASQDGDESVF